ncbi:MULTISPECIES: DUF6284 family protein [unclassified Micromonospora]|uniref:DUF6284 family protein n=1 Tax=unclassified Micromonospora TaxID=2617518 RepID=UPI00098CFD53|nr:MULTISPECIES: DUF6284 family protein [unclassified Micromonospora]MDI5937079.1 DUF6284 family protein [Micromonospora sp. DH15]OON29232.1 hypothetical protein BSA16_22485 [Micromonospora sp. Rc5]
MAEPQRHPEEFREPSATDLAAIEQEMPLIEAEVMLLDAQITLLFSDAVLSEMDWQRLRRAQRRVLREARALLAVRGAPVRRVA